MGLIPEPWDKLAHAGVFAKLALAAGYASGWRDRTMWWLGFCVALAVWAIDELHQMWLPGTPTHQQPPIAGRRVTASEPAYAKDHGPLARPANFPQSCQMPVQGAMTSPA